MKQSPHRRLAPNVPQSRALAMLVLSRKVGERIVIGDQIRVTVVRVNGGTVRLGIEAPQSTSILREELQVEPPTKRGERSMRVA